jgi:hypothetical protein
MGSGPHMRDEVIASVDITLDLKRFYLSFW